MTQQNSLGVINHAEPSNRRADYLYRISLKGFIRNEKGEILVVKETGRDWWDLPGGGMDHSEDIKTALARELKEEVNLTGDFTYRIIDVSEPAYINNLDIWQIRLVFEVIPENMEFSAGEEGDEIAFMNSQEFESCTSNAVKSLLKSFDKLISKL